MERKLKTVFQLDTPYTAVQWPQIAPNDQETIVELLISLLAPIGNARALHAAPSKGKRSKKRKRQEEKDKGFCDVSANGTESPPAPVLASHLLVGLNSITRHLELLSRSKRLQSGTESIHSDVKHTVETDPPRKDSIETETPNHLAAVFLTHSSLPSVLHAHLLQLMVTASGAHPKLPPARLVQLPQGCENRLCSSLGLPRASFVGILEDTPHAKTLVEFVREVVPVIEIQWLKEAQSAEYRPLKVNTTQTMMPLVAKSTPETN